MPIDQPPLNVARDDVEIAPVSGMDVAVVENDDLLPIDLQQVTHCEVDNVNGSAKGNGDVAPHLVSLDMTEDHASFYPCFPHGSKFAGSECTPQTDDMQPMGVDRPFAWPL